MNPVIKKATSDDIPAITAIYADAVLNGRASFELTPPDEAQMQKRFDLLVNNGFPYYVARVEGAVAGYAYAGPYHTRPGYKWTVENTVYVNPANHGQGLGSKLLDQLILDCTAKNFRQMIAVIGDSANLGSIRLHEKAGFSHCGTMKGIGRKHGVWLDSVIMQRQLGKGDAGAAD